eukprot:SAG11_NODE_6530_length_1294_cov_0.685356_5_plen_34_part_01
MISTDRNLYVRFVVIFGGGAMLWVEGGAAPLFCG